MYIYIYIYAYILNTINIIIIIIVITIIISIITTTITITITITINIIIMICHFCICRAYKQATSPWIIQPSRGADLPALSAQRCTSGSRLQRTGIFHTVSCHNFKSQIFKLSVSNPKSKHVAYLSVLSQIKNCQGLGRKNKREILKTDRTFGDFTP